VRTAAALAELPPAPDEPPTASSDTTPYPLQGLRVAMLLGVVGVAWLAMMVWEQFILR